jgi:hypothetical protein
MVSFFIWKISVLTSRWHKYHIDLRYSSDSWHLQWNSAGSDEQYFSDKIKIRTIKYTLTFINERNSSAKSLSEKKKFVFLGNLLMVQNSFSGQFYWITRHVGPVTEAIFSVILVHGKEELCVLWTNKNCHIFIELPVNLKQYTPLLWEVVICKQGDNRWGLYYI